MMLNATRPVSNRAYDMPARHRGERAAYATAAVRPVAPALRSLEAAC
jgi:hypothetical protein